MRRSARPALARRDERSAVKDSDNPATEREMPLAFVCILSRLRCLARRAARFDFHLRFALCGRRGRVLPYESFELL